MSKIYIMLDTDDHTTSIHYTYQEASSIMKSLQKQGRNITLTEHYIDIKQVQDNEKEKKEQKTKELNPKAKTAKSKTNKSRMDAWMDFYERRMKERESRC